MRRRRIEVRSQLRARLRTLRLGHLWARSYWFGCRWGKLEGRLSSLPNEMRTKLGLLDVGSTWHPFPPEVAANILTDLLLERNSSPKLDFRFTEFSEVHLAAPQSFVDETQRVVRGCLPRPFKLVAPLQAASRPEHHPPVRPYYEHRKED